MKKRIISLLLTVAMLVSLCTVFVASASADANVTTVTMASGDTVLALCQKLGVDYYTYKNLIMTLNGFTSEGQFSKLAVGSKIVLPVSASAAAALAGGTAASAAAPAPLSGGAAASASTPGAGGATAIPAGDYVSYYLVSYTIQPGETIGGIYANWGLSYKTYDNQIKKLNNIVNYNSIAAGKTMLLPTTNPAMASAAYYTVMAHVMKSGESAYDVVCSKYGLNYSASQSMLMALNNTNDLSYIQMGRTLYIPMAGLVTASSVVSTATSTTTTTASVSTGASYNLVSQTPVNGSFDLQVNGSSVITAQAGKTVNIVAVPNPGYTVDTIKVVKVGDASTGVGVSGTSFTMPNFSVIVSVTFKTAKFYKIDHTSNGNGSTTAMVNGEKVNGSYVGSTVTVKTTPDAGFMLNNIRVTYNKGKDSVAVYNNTFIMPDVDVEIVSTFEKDPNYDPSLGFAIYSEVEHGAIETSVGNAKVKNAKAGERVSITVTPETNYTVQKITVYYDNFNKTAEVDKNSFTMPSSPVTIVATIRPTASAAFDITKVDNVNGTFKCLVDNTEVSSAKIGANVVVQGKPKASAYNYIVTVRETGGTRSVEVVENPDGSSSFVMPEFPVSVSAKFYLYHKVILDASNGENGTFGVFAGSIPVSTCASGVQLNVSVWNIRGGYSASNVILTYANGSSYTLDGANFIMPDCDVRVRVNFSQTQSIVAHSITVNGGYGKFGNTYSVGGKTLNGNKEATVEVAAGIGSNVVLNTAPAFGYEVDSISIAYTDEFGAAKTAAVTRNPVTDKYQFQMPRLASGTKLHLYVSFKEITTYTVTCNYIEGYPADDTNASHKKGTFNVTTMDRSAFVSSAPAGTKIQIHCYPASGYKDDKANVKVINLSTGTEVEINKNDYTFIMPEANVDVIVPFIRTAHFIKLERANLGTDGNPKGVLSAIVNGIEYTDNQLVYLSSDNTNNNIRVTFEPGTLVTIVNHSRDGYVLNSEQPIVVRKIIDGSLVPYAMIDGDHFTFDMPNCDVVVNAQYIDEMVPVNAMPTENGSFSVPKQVAWNGKFDVSEIYPADGFELAEIAVTYTGHDGTQHTKEVLSGTTVDLSAEQGMLKSDINVYVTFRPALNPLTIHYIFDDEADINSNYKVNLLVDGAKIQGITRGAFDPADLYNNGAKYDDLLPKYDAGQLTGYGIPTGKTVVIERNESKLDKNFNIVNIWVRYSKNGGEDVAIKPEFANNQYFFKMPYIGTGDYKDITLCIEYAKHTSDAYALSAFKSAGDGEVSSWQFYLDGAPSNHAKVGSGPIQLEVIVPPECVIADDPTTPWDETTVIIRYTDSDGVAHPTEAELASYPAIKLTEISSGVYWCEFDPSDDSFYPYITSMPSPATVTAEYQVQRKSYAAPTKDNVKFDADKFEINNPTVKDVNLTYSSDGLMADGTIKWGHVVTMTAAPTTPLEIQDAKIFETDGINLGNPVEVTKVGGQYQFIMPKSAIAVFVETKEASSVLTVTETSTSTGVLTEKKILILNDDGTVTEQIFTDMVALPTGARFKLAVKAAGCTLVDADNDGNPDVTINPALTPDADGAYTMPAGSVVVEYEVKKNQAALLVRCAIDSPVIVDSSMIKWYVNGTLGATAINYGDVLTIEGLADYAINSISVKYPDVNGNAGTANIQYNVDANGSAAITLDSEVNTSGEGVIVDIYYKENIVPHTVRGTVDGLEQTEASLATAPVKVSFDVGGGRQYQLSATKGTTVTVFVDVKYYYDLSKDKIGITNATPEPVYMNETKLNLVSGLDINKAYKTYSFTFQMPNSDVTVDVASPDEPWTYTISKSRGSFTAKVGTTEITSDNPAKLDDGVMLDYTAYTDKDAVFTVEYKSEDGTVHQKQYTNPTTGTAVFNLYSDYSLTHVPMGRVVTIALDYVSKP